MVWQRLESWCSGLARCPEGAEGLGSTPKVLGQKENLLKSQDMKKQCNRWVE